jgi:hypothetical protein
MKHIKQGIQLVKKNFASLFLAQFLFIFISFFYFIYLKTHIEKYLKQLSALTPSIEAVKQAADRATTNTELETLLNTIGPPTQSTLFLLFVVTPLVLLAFWFIFQMFTWKTLNKHHMKNTKNYYKNFIMTTMIACVLLIILYHLKISSILFNLIVIFFIYYFTTVSYNLKESKYLRNPLILGIKKFPSYAPYILLLFITSVALSFLFVTLYLSYTTKDFFFLTPTILILYMCLVFVLNIFVKAVTAAKLHNN